MNINIHTLLIKKFPEIKIEKDIPTRYFSFVRTGGIAKTVIFPKSINELSEIINFLNFNSIKYVVLGKCSNVLFSDNIISLIIIKTDLLTNITINGNNVYAECGVGLCQLAIECLKEDLSGFEFACGIPGSIGGGIIMNAGAFGSCISNIIKKVYIGGEVVTGIDNKDCGFSYRNSRFLKSKECILAAEFELKEGDINEIRANVSAITLNRNNIQPKGLTLGSTFKNPTNKSAGELIEKAGLKSFGINGAIISQKHANFIMNTGGTTSTDIKLLIDYIKETVFKHFNIQLEEEIQYIGEF